MADGNSFVPGKRPAGPAAKMAVLRSRRQGIDFDQSVTGGVVFPANNRSGVSSGTNNDDARFIAIGLKAPKGWRTPRRFAN